MDPEDLVQIMTHIGSNLRFDHKRVSFVPAFMMNDPFRTALSTEAQPYFAGVAVNHAEWQQADCPGLDPPNAAPPEVLFQVAGCDDSFCPLYDCTQTLDQTGWDHADVRMGTSISECPCPTPDDREHYEGRGPYGPIVDFVLSVSR
jgi:hypothetical protein